MPKAHRSFIQHARVADHAARSTVVQVGRDEFVLRQVARRLIDSGIAGTVRTFLEGVGVLAWLYEAGTAGRGDDLDLILVDVRMTHPDVWTFLRVLEDIPGLATPVVLTTPRDRWASTAARGRQHARVLSCLPQPADMSDLAWLVEHPHEAIVGDASPGVPVVRDH
jgi:CheY-like chemotaxis protein